MLMKYQITSDNIDLSESMKVLAVEKLQKIESKLTDKQNESSFARVVLNKAAADAEFKVKVELDINGKTYFAEQKDFAMETALIRTIDEALRMFEKAKRSESTWQETRDLKRNPEDLVDVE